MIELKKNTKKESVKCRCIRVWTRNRATTMMTKACASEWGLRVPSIHDMNLSNLAIRQPDIWKAAMNNPNNSGNNTDGGNMRTPTMAMTQSLLL